MRCSRVRRFLSGYPAFGFQLSAFDLPARGVLLPIPTRNPFKHLHLQLFLDRDRNHVVTCYLILSHQPGRTALQAAPLRNLCVRRLPRLPRASRGLGHGVGACPELLGALDSSSLGLTLNLQLSTFNRVSFLSPSSPHLCALYVLCGENSSSFRSSLTPRHSPLATNSFIIRTYEKFSCKSFRIRTCRNVGGGRPASRCGSSVSTFNFQSKIPTRSGLSTFIRRFRPRRNRPPDTS